MPQSSIFRALEIARVRRARRKRREQSLGRRLQLGALLAFSLVSIALAAAAIVAAPVYDYLSRDLPPIQNLESLLNPVDGALLQPTSFYDQDGGLLFRLAPAGIGPRSFIQASDAPMLAAAVIASQDPDFYQHEGYQLSGGSTLAEQLVSDLLAADWDNNTVNRWRIRLLAAEATEKYGRDQILTWYLNSANFGKLAFGAQTAAQVYFGKPAAELSLGESAMLVATLDAPAINPIDAFELVRGSQQVLLLRMLDKGLADQQAVTEALVEEIQVAQDPGVDLGEHPDFAKVVIQQAKEALGQEIVERGGLEIVSTLRPDLQADLAGLTQVSESRAVVLEAESGNILAFIGQAAAPQEAPGSLLAPFVYLNAFANGLSPASLTWDTPDQLLSSLGPYANEDGNFHGPLTLRQALANNYLVPTVGLADEFGAKSSLLAAQQAGLLNLDVEAGLKAFADGTNISQLELAHGYATLANLGQLRGQKTNDEILPNAILRIEDGEDNVLIDNQQSTQQAVISPELAFLVSDVLSDAGARQGPDRLRGLGALLVANGDMAGWAIAYSPEVVVSVYAENAAELIPELFSGAHQTENFEAWSAPPGLSSEIVCVPSGLLPDEDCPLTRRDYFLSGFEPQQRDDLFLRVAVNRHSGNLATVFTPLEFIVEELVLNIPAGSRDWAQNAGFPVAPEDYDVVVLPSTTSNLNISSPEPFAQVNDTVEIRGSARGEDFEEYRILVGKGLYPDEWLEIMRSTRPTQLGLLARWETGELSGLYAVQLQIITQDGEVRSTYSLVTLGN